MTTLQNAARRLRGYYSNHEHNKRLARLYQPTLIESRRVAQRSRRASNHELAQYTNRISQDRAVKQLTDYYIRKILRKNHGVSDPTPAQIDQRRSIIQAKRFLKIAQLHLASSLMKTISSKPKTSIEEFVSLVSRGIDAWQAAGEKLVEAMDSDPGFLDKVRAAHPEISVEMLSIFERIGRKQVHAPLLADASVGARQLLELPYEIQVKYAAGSVDVITDFKSGKVEKRRISELNRSEAKQVFVDGGVLTPKQQLAEHADKSSSSRMGGASTATPVVKRIQRIGCFRISVKNGVVTAVACEESFRAQQVKLEEGSADILFYRMS